MRTNNINIKNLFTLSAFMLLAGVLGGRISVSFMNTYKVITEEKSRIKKAKKIIAVLENFVYPFKDKNILDIGCGSGIISYELSEYGNKNFAIDVTDRYITSGISNTPKLAFLLAIGEKLPFKEEVFDIVLCNHVLEHVNDKHSVIQEIKRVLKRGGYAYISQGNKLWPIEPHYKLPFLSYLPRNIANQYVKLRGVETYDDISLPTYGELCDLFRHNFHEIFDVTYSVVKYPEKYDAEDIVNDIFRNVIKVIPKQLYRYVRCALPGWIFVVGK